MTSKSEDRNIPTEEAGRDEKVQEMLDRLNGHVTELVEKTVIEVDKIASEFENDENKFKPFGFIVGGLATNLIYNGFMRVLNAKGKEAAVEYIKVGLRQIVQHANESGVANITMFTEDRQKNADSN